MPSVEMNERPTETRSEDEITEYREQQPVLRINEHYDPIAILLSGYGDNAENITLELRKHGIKYENLASLDDKDLELLGMTDPKVRKEVLAEIADTPNQADHYEQIMKNLDLHGYNRTVLNNVAEHLDNITNILSATDLKLKLDPPKNVLLDHKTYASTEILEVLLKMENQCMEIESMLQEIKLEGRHLQIKSKNNGLFHNFKKLFIGTGLLMGVSYLAYKFLKSNK